MWLDILIIYNIYCLYISLFMLVANLPDGGSSLLPLECLYLNRTALVAMVGPQPPLPKHFTLRRKPKSAALRAELTQKGTSIFALHVS